VISPTSYPSEISGLDPAALMGDLTVRAAQSTSTGPSMATIQEWDCTVARNYAVIIVLDAEKQFERNGNRMRDFFNSMGKAGPAQTLYASPYADEGVTHKWDPKSGDDAILARIQQIFDKLAQDVRPCDSVFIHISGHNIPQESPTLVR